MTVGNLKPYRLQSAFFYHSITLHRHRHCICITYPYKAQDPFHKMKMIMALILTYWDFVKLN